MKSALKLAGCFHGDSPVSLASKQSFDRNAHFMDSCILWDQSSFSLWLPVLQTMTDVVGNPEEERRAEFYYQPWAQEAVCRYFYSKVNSSEASSSSLLQWMLVRLKVHLSCSESKRSLTFWCAESFRSSSGDRSWSKRSASGTPKELCHRQQIIGRVVLSKTADVCVCVGCSKWISQEFSDSF